ncbi:MAG: hypothetical protein ACFE9L_16825 [Candidatus Hodarchaeota archaeon]
MGPLDKLDWKIYFLIGGLLVIWAVVAIIILMDLFNLDPLFSVLIGVVCTGALLIIIAIIDRI